ncbi:hypothetical protein ACROYT_G020145 [Oculina patagonica]
MTSFDFKQWCQTSGLKEGTIEQLEKNDLDSQEALKLVNKDDVATLDLTLGQRKLLLQAVALLDSKGKSDESKKTKSSETGPQPAQGKKGGEEKPFLIPDFVSTGSYDGSIEDEQEIGGSTGARIVLRAPRSKPKLENISLSMWVAANARIMHQLTNTGKLSGTSQIADYLSYTVKVAELLESHTLASVVIYDNEYRKLQHQYGFRWGSDSQHLHTNVHLSLANVRFVPP